MLSIWHEFDTPKGNISQEEVAEVMYGAELGYDRASWSPRETPRQKLLLDEFSESQIGSLALSDIATPETYIGFAIGLRAEQEGLDVLAKKASGYMVSARDMVAIRGAKIITADLVKHSPDQSFADAYKAVVEFSLSTDGVSQKRSSMMDVIANGIGLRAALKQGVTV